MTKNPPIIGLLDENKYWTCKHVGGGGGIVKRENNRSCESFIGVYNLTKQTFNYAMSSPMNR